MATGDIAASAGLPVASPADDIREGYDSINEVSDALGTHIISGGHPWSKITDKPATFTPPFKVAYGAVSVTFSARSSHTLAVTFAGSPGFTVAPSMGAPNIANAGVEAVGWIARAYNVTTTGFTLYLAQVDGTPVAWSANTVTYIAMGV